MLSNIQGLPLPGIDAASKAAKAPEQGSGFTGALKDAVHQIDQLQEDAQGKIGEVMKGNGSDLHSAMIAVEKADLSFQLMLQVRNKIVAAYQEVARMNF